MSPAEVFVCGLTLPNKEICSPSVERQGWHGGEQAGPGYQKKNKIFGLELVLKLA